jgi:hypothetical protein
MKRLAGIFLAAVMIALIVSGCGGSSSSTSKSSSTPRQRVREALGDKVAAGGSVGDVKINRVSFSFSGNDVRVLATTPKGGSHGVKCSDLNTGAKAIFQKIYKNTGWKGGSHIGYQGGLVDSATGRPRPHARTGAFNMLPDQAKQIDWSNNTALSNVDWSTYRDFCHPALQ